MVRVPYIDMETLDPLAEDPTPYNPEWVSGNNIHRAMAHHPEALRVFWPRIGTWMRYKSGLDQRLRELAIIQASYVTASGYEFAHHVHFAETIGITHDDILAIIDESNGKPGALPDLERAVLKAARDLTLTVEIADETWAYLAANLRREHLIELVLVTSYYNHVIRLVTALQIGIEDGRAHETSLAPYLERYAPPASVGYWR